MRAIKIILKIFATIILFALGFNTAMQGSIPVYEFPLASRFEGERVFSPYQGVDFSNQLKANFHAHTMFDTREDYTEEEFEKVYQDAGYDYIGVANHNFVTNSLSDRPNYIPTYENGWNIQNYHILVLGAKENALLEVPYMSFPRSYMQWKINRLRNDCELISLNHPERFRLGNKSAYRSLRGYDLIEANTNNDRRVWDEVLTDGVYVPILGSDDAHSITNLAGPLQRAYTMVLGQNSPSGILNAIKNGHSYAVVGRGDALGELHPRFVRYEVLNDTAYVACDMVMDQFKLISEGRVLMVLEDIDTLILPLNGVGSYLRIEAIKDDVTLVANPFARSKDGKRPLALAAPEVNIGLTVTYSLLWWSVTLIFLWLIIKMWFKRRKKNMRNNNHFENRIWGIGTRSYDHN